ncbi:putative membrane protein [Helicobacter pylori Hp P-62]|nr:putative membrane protein [Helicobacter pylori Hp P-62]
MIFDFNRLWFLFVVFDFLLCLFLCLNVWFFVFSVFYLLI